MMMKRRKATIESETEQQYFDWLTNKVDRRERSRWRGLLRSLYLDYAFYCLVPNDDNRGVDGCKLREQFGLNIGESRDVDAILDKPCSLLEMLIALAYRMEFILYDPDHQEEREDAKWFWLLIRNLGLKPGAEFQEENHNRIERFLERKYEPNGVGGVFPIPSSRKDQREIELWYQLQEYIQKVLM